MEALNDLKVALPATEEQVDKLLDQARIQLDFAKGAYQQAQNNSFVNIVRDDLAFYQSQQLHKITHNQ